MHISYGKDFLVCNIAQYAAMSKLDKITNSGLFPAYKYIVLCYKQTKNLLSVNQMHWEVHQFETSGSHSFEYNQADTPLSLIWRKVVGSSKAN